MSAQFAINTDDFNRLHEALRNFPGDGEKVINEVLHGEGADLIQERIRQFMPVSDKKKGTHAQSAKSMTSVGGNLSVTTKSTKKYNYLYFPDDGTNTRRHVGNQQFFRRGAEDAAGAIVDICLERLTKKIEEGE